MFVYMHILTLVPFIYIGLTSLILTPHLKNTNSNFLDHFRCWCLLPFRSLSLYSNRELNDCLGNNRFVRCPNSSEGKWMQIINALRISKRAIIVCCMFTAIVQKCFNIKISWNSEMLLCTSVMKLFMVLYLVNDLGMRMEIGNPEGHFLKNA